MYAVVRLAGKQFWVKPNEIVDVPLLELEPGTVISIDEVLAYSDGTDVRVGKPLVEGVKNCATSEKARSWRTPAKPRSSSTR